MSNNNYSNGLNPDESLSASAFDPNLVESTLPPIPPFTLPTGPTGLPGPRDRPMHWENWNNWTYRAYW